jgi:uncharacterized membrane protein
MVHCGDDLTAVRRACVYEWGFPISTRNCRMTETDTVGPSFSERVVDMRDGALRAYREFLRTPTFMVTGFLLLALGMYLLDNRGAAWIDPLRQLLKERLFVDSRTTSDFLAAIAGGIISVTSITISLLLLAVQQSAGSLTSAVLDQFLRRTRNQAYFGFFIGLALYCLIVLSTVHESANAVLSATVGFALTVVALYLLILLLYSTIHQMRPSIIVAAITDHALRARDRQWALFQRMRGTAPVARAGAATTRVESQRRGYLVDIHLDSLAEALAERDVEVVLAIPIGGFVTRHDLLAEVRGGDPSCHDAVVEALQEALVIERHRAGDCDPGYSIEQLARIAWVTISTAKSNPGPATHAIRAMRELLLRWAETPDRDSDVEVLPVVYQDSLARDLTDALESAMVVCSESRQHQNFAEILDVFSATAHRVPAAQRDAMAAMVERSIDTLGEHVLTRQLCASLAAAAATLTACGRPRAAARMRTTRDRFGRSMDELCGS